MIYLKSKRKVYIFLKITIIIIIVTTFIPVKFTINSKEAIVAKEYYIVYQVPSGSTDSGSWICIGNHDGLFEKSFNVIVEGKLPKDIITDNICDTNTKFIMYGSLVQKSDDIWGYIYIINSNGWDIFGDIHRRDNFLRMNFKHYITIYDLKWF